VVRQATEPGTAQYHCDLGNIDVGEAVVLNGAGRVAANASEAAGRGIWPEYPMGPHSSRRLRWHDGDVKL
jgi:hypothetical protein